MSQNYGALRVVRVRAAANATADLQERYPAGWLPEERLVHLISQRETTIGRALNNSVILMDGTVSREHARLVLTELGWRISNLTLHNVVRVNGRAVPSGGSLPLQPQDYLVLGSTILQLIAPQPGSLDVEAGVEVEAEDPTVHLTALQGFSDEAIYLEDQEDGHHPGKRNGDDPGSLRGRRGSGSGLQSPIKPSAAYPLRNTPPALFIPKLPVVPASTPPLPVQPEPEMIAQSWDGEDESLMGAGITLQFALPQRLGTRTRWLIAGGGIAVLVISAVVTLTLNSLVGLSALKNSGLSSVLAALTIPVIPAVGIFLLVNFMDRYEREPWFLRLAAFLWGAIIAIPPALFIEMNIDPVLPKLLGANPSNLALSMLQGLSVGVTEETVKGLGLLLLFVVLRDEFDNVTDGIVYGALIGAGFAMVENFIYFAQNPKALVLLIVGRILLGWLSHSTFIVCFGAALGYVRHTRVRWRQLLVPFVGYLASVALHSMFDFVNFFTTAMANDAPTNSTVTSFSLIAIIGNYIPPFIAQIVILYILTKSLAHEAAVVREYLAPEVSNGVVKVDEYALLQNSFQRTKRERQILFSQGIKQWQRAKALYQTEIGLAFRKWHVSMGDKPKLGYLQPEDAYRQRIRRLRLEITSAEQERS